MQQSILKFSQPQSTIKDVKSSTVNKKGSPVVTVAIIGTAGRGADGARLSQELIQEMKLEAMNIIQTEFKLELERVRLVSGGAAGADHVAPLLFLEAVKTPKPFRGLSIHLPCDFEAWYDEKKQSTQFSICMEEGDGKIMKYYHTLFSKKMGYETLQDFTRVFEQKALFNPPSKQTSKAKTPKRSFKSRNQQVAESDYMIAFTFGVGGVKDGGTKMTWDMSKAPISRKRHVELDVLLERISLKKQKMKDSKTEKTTEKQKDSKQNPKTESYLKIPTQSKHSAYFLNVIPKEKRQDYYNHFKSLALNAPQVQIEMYGKRVDEPRNVAYFSDDPKDQYSYSNRMIF